MSYYKVKLTSLPVPFPYESPVLVNVMQKFDSASSLFIETVTPAHKKLTFVR